MLTPTAAEGLTDFEKCTEYRLTILLACTMTTPQLPLPATFNAALTTEVLATVAGWLLEEQRFTDDDLQRPTDSAYTRGCAAFGRQKNRIVQEWLTGKYGWLSLANGKSNDLVFLIGLVPCRFASDSSENPSKSAVLETHEFQVPFAEFSRPGEPARYCFVIDASDVQEQEPRVVFVGYSATGEIVCRWESDRIRRLSRVDDPELPKAVDLDKPLVTPKRRKTDADEADDMSGAAGA